MVDRVTDGVLVVGDVSPTGRDLTLGMLIQNFNWAGADEEQPAQQLNRDPGRRRGRRARHRARWRWRSSRLKRLRADGRVHGRWHVACFRVMRRESLVYEMEWILDDITRSSWAGLLAGRRRDEADLSIVMPIGDSTGGGSGAFLARASDDRRYWVKPLNNFQGERVPITEQIVGRAGSLIGAPTCAVRTLAVGEDVAGWTFRNNGVLVKGIAHGSLNVEHCVETRGLEYRAHDDNRSRHALILALHDWCWGGDGQWLHVERDGHRYYSHDHGWYLPPEGETWNAAEMESKVDEPHEYPDPATGFDLFSAQQVAKALARISRDRIVDVLAAIPTSWPVTDEELEAVGYFLERRGPQVAARMQTRLGGAT